tara:strand:- start:1348 stop:2040 length:693 start_codon:yes stop_codon:yes gene_type:complete
MQKNKAFSIIELLVVIAIIGVIAFFAYPGIQNWIADREVKKEVLNFVEYFNEKKSDVQNGKYGVLMIGQTTPEQAKSSNYYITNEEFSIQMKIPADGRTNRNKPGQYGNKSIMNFYKMCPGSPQNSPDARWITDQSGAFQWSSDVYTWPNKKYCVSKDALLFPGELEFNVTSTEKASFIICSRSNTTNSNGNNRCNYSNKNDLRYAIKVSRNLDLKVFKYNKSKDVWIEQ